MRESYGDRRGGVVKSALDPELCLSFVLRSRKNDAIWRRRDLFHATLACNRILTALSTRSDGRFALWAGLLSQNRAHHADFLRPDLQQRLEAAYAAERLPSLAHESALLQRELDETIPSLPSYDQRRLLEVRPYPRHRCMSFDALTDHGEGAASE